MMDEVHSLVDDDEHAKSPSWEGWEHTELLFGLELQSPYAEFILDRTKTIETRTYPLPQALINKKIAILRSEMGVEGVSSISNREEILVSTTRRKEGSSRCRSSSPLERLGWCTFVQSFRYTDKETFENDVSCHLVDATSKYGWIQQQLYDRPLYGWVVGEVGYYNNDDDNDEEYVAIRRFRSLFELIKK
jgi:hypothetical protein